MTNDQAIILLKECKEEHSSFKEGCEALDLAIAALERDRWISVNQRLPKEGQVVLAQGLRSCTTGQFQGITTAPRYWWWKGHTIKEVTHWRPLPEPPKEET